MDVAPIGIVITDPTREDNPITDANDGFLRLTGYAEREVLGRNCRFLQGEGTDPEPVAEMREGIANERPTTVELLNYRKDGTPFWNLVSIAPVYDDGDTLTHFAGFQRDVTDRKIEERRARRQLETFEDFADVLAHDLRDPLNTVEGRLEMAAESGDTEHLEPAQRAVERLGTLTEDLATVLRDGALVEEVAEVDFEACLRAAWASFDTAEATLVIEDSVHVRGDENAVTRLLENVIGSALEHAGEAVTVRVGGLRRGFYVEDDGPGIPDDRREAVFDPGVTTKEAGSELELASVTRIALAHGWEVEVRDGADGGARFEFKDGLGG